MDFLILILSLIFLVYIIKNKNYNLDFVLCVIFYVLTIFKCVFVIIESNIQEITYWPQIALILAYFVIVMMGCNNKKNTVIRISAISFLLIRIVKEFFFRVMLRDILERAIIVSENNSCLRVLTICAAILDAMEIIIISLIFFVYTKRNKNDKIIQ